MTPSTGHESVSVRAYTLAGLLASLSVAFPLFFGALWRAGGEPPGRLSVLAALASAVLTAAAAALLVRRAHWARALLAGGVLAFFGSVGPVLVVSPVAAFWVGCLGLALLGTIFAAPAGFVPRSERPRSSLAAARGSLLAAVFAWFSAVPAQAALTEIGEVSGLASVAVATLLALRAVLEKGVEQRWRRALAWIMCAVAIGGAIWEGSDLASSTTWLLIAPLGVSFLGGSRVLPLPSSPSSWYEPILSQPARLLVGTFAVAISVGAVLLWLPVSSTRPGSISLVDALFTAVSATCVTGLIVLDTPVDFTRFGQGVILALIQVGGLGIMTFSTAALVLLRRRASLQHEAAMADLLGEGKHSIQRAVRDIFAVTLGSELVGGLLLAGLFHRLGDPPMEALWRGIFTAVSAFCNAGFALQSDSLMPYAGHAAVLHTVAVVIVIGGLGPSLVASLGRGRQRAGTALPSLVLISSVLLTVGPAMAILGSEWSNTLAGLSWSDRLHNAWFQSVTTRTAGFNSVDFAALRPATVVLMMGLMIIGGSPGSTAGGIKTTTFAVLALTVLAAIRGRTEVVVAQRRIGHATVYKAAAIATVMLASIFAGALALLSTHDIPPLVALFEVVSALGTVGLSMGATGELDDIGKVIIMLAMFAGRVGPLTLFLLLGREPRGGWVLPEEEVPVG